MKQALRKVRKVLCLSPVHAAFGLYLCTVATSTLYMDAADLFLMLEILKLYTL